MCFFHVTAKEYVFPLNKVHLTTSGDQDYEKKGVSEEERDPSMYKINQGQKHTRCQRNYTFAGSLSFRYSFMAFAAFLPAPIAEMTVADPVTMSPPAYTPSMLVRPVSSSATI